MIKFTIGGKSVDPKNLRDALMAAALEHLRATITEKVGSIRDPETGEFPTVIVRGDSIDCLTLHVEGSPNLVALARKRLGLEEDMSDTETGVTPSPRVFLSYAFEDTELARKLAETMLEKGIDTWWAEWCIAPGDSLRQKIDEGIGDCTHFLVLLTPQSIKKPWVNQEMDAGLVRKLSDRCKFLPVRHTLPTKELPPLLSGMLSPPIETDADIAQLIHDIYGVSRKPPRGAAPPLVQTSADANTGYSAAATAIARFFVEHTKHALFADPQIDIDALAHETELSLEDTTDALYELRDFFKDRHRHWLVKDTLFAEFDRYWKPWSAADDALKLAVDILNDPDIPADCKEIAERYRWAPRRLNPAVCYLLERDLIMNYQAMGTQPWAIVRIVGRSDSLRRFVKSRS
jgi:hypothetical protein